MNKKVIYKNISDEWCYYLITPTRKIELCSHHDKERVVKFAEASAYKGEIIIEDKNEG